MRSEFERDKMNAREIIDSHAEHYLNGTMTQEQIAIQAGVGAQSVYQRYRYLGLTAKAKANKRARRAAEKIEKVTPYVGDYMADKLNMTQIGELCGYSVTVIADTLRKLGVAIKPSGRRSGPQVRPPKPIKEKPVTMEVIELPQPKFSIEYRDINGQLTPVKVYSALHNTDDNELVLRPSYRVEE